MQQFSVRLSDEHGAAVRRLAAARRRSINQTFEDLVAAASDATHAGSELVALRERLSRAGLVFDMSALPDAPAPDERGLERARAAAGRGTPLSERKRGPALSVWRDSSALVKLYATRTERSRHDPGAERSL